MELLSILDMPVVDKFTFKGYNVVIIKNPIPFSYSGFITNLPNSKVFTEYFISLVDLSIKSYIIKNFP